MLRHNTPIEQYTVNGRTIYVKREDLSTNPPLPPLAKLRGASVLLQGMKAQGVRLVGNQDTAVSKSGQGVAAICQELGMSCILGYPDSAQGPPEQLRIAQELGAELYPLRPNYIRILYYQTKRYVESKGGVMLPFGLTCVESALAVAEEAATVPEELLDGTLIICVGTGTMLAGVAIGLKRLPKIIGVSSGMSVQKQMETLRELFLFNMKAERVFEFFRDKFTLVPPIMPYHKQCLGDLPFPSHPNYDKKAWVYMLLHLDELKGPCLFWNIGA